MTDGGSTPSLVCACQKVRRIPPRVSPPVCALGQISYSALAAAMSCYGGVASYMRGARSAIIDPLCNAHRPRTGRPDAARLQRRTRPVATCATGNKIIGRLRRPLGAEGLGGFFGDAARTLPVLHCAVPSQGVDGRPLPFPHSHRPNGIYSRETADVGKTGGRCMRQTGSRLVTKNSCRLHAYLWGISFAFLSGSWHGHCITRPVLCSTHASRKGRRGDSPAR